MGLLARGGSPRSSDTSRTRSHSCSNHELGALSGGTRAVGGGKLSSCEPVRVEPGRGRSMGI